MPERPNYNPQENKAHQIDDFFNKKFRAGEELKYGNYVKQLEIVERLCSLESGVELVNGDTKEQLLRDINTRIPNFNFEQYKEWVSNYRLPEFGQIVSRDGKIDNQSLHEYRMAVASVPRSDIRNYSEIELTFLAQNGRVFLSSDNRFSYDPEKIVLAWAAQDFYQHTGDGKYTEWIEMPYVHYSNDRKIISKTLLRFSKTQVDNLMKVNRTILEQEGKLNVK